MNTVTIRIPLTGSTEPLDSHIAAECDVRYAAGFRLASSFVHEDQLVLIFQKK